MGGRVDDFAVVESDPRIIYVASAAGGIFKTVNGGVTWEPIFDDQPNSTIGDLALAPSDPSILWVGTGEPNNRQSSSWGNGVYKSMDAGHTWTHMGLEETHHIGRVVIHPSDPNIVYVAALGHLWGPNKERGVFKTTDGGATWTHSLFINEDTGVSDIAIDPQSPNTLYAAAYERRRTVFGYNGGGPSGGIYKTVDGGAHWTKLTKGLPATGDIGRCAVDVSRKNPNIVYALVENIEGRRHLPLRRQGLLLDAHERHRSAAFLLQPGSYRSQQRPEDLGARRASLLQRRRRPNFPYGSLAAHPQRFSRAVDRSGEFRSHGPRLATAASP